MTTQVNGKTAVKAGSAATLESRGPASGGPRATVSQPVAVGVAGQNRVEEALKAARGDLLKYADEVISEDMPEGHEPEGGEEGGAQRSARPTSPGAEEEESASTSVETRTRDEDEEIAEAPGEVEEAVDGAAPEGAELKLPEEVQEAVNRRISKVVGERKAAEERAAELEARIAELEATNLSEGGAHGVVALPGPLGNVRTKGELEAELGRARKAQAAAEDLLDLVDEDPDGVASQLRADKVELPEFTPVAMKRFLRSVRRNTAETIEAGPKRLEFLQQEAGYAVKAQELLPELKQRTSPRYQKFQQVLGMFPELRNRPYWQYSAAVHVLGLEALEARIKATSVAATAPGAGARGSAATLESRGPKPPMPPKLPGVPKGGPGGSANGKPTKGVNEETRKKALLGDKEARVRLIEAQLGTVE